MKKNVLYFEGAGMEGTQINDVDNCRIRTAFTNGEGNYIYLEISSTWEKQACINSCFYITPDKDNCNESNIFSVKKIFNFKVAYTKKGILSFINKKLHCNFDEIVILPWLSGYYVHSGKNKIYGRYCLMDDFNYNEEATNERVNIYNDVAKEYYNQIYNKHIEKHEEYRKLLSEYRTWDFISYDDEKITLRSHTCDKLIDENEREHTFYLKGNKAVQNERKVM